MEYTVQVDPNAQAPAAYLSRAVIKSYCRIESAMTDDDALIDRLEQAARNYIEDRARIALVATTFNYYASMPSADGRVYLPRYPVTAVNSFKMYNSSGSQTTLSAGTDYRASIISHNPHLAPVQTGWPTWIPLLSGPPRWDYITVNFTAGYTNTTRPGQLDTALLSLVAFWYENRGVGKAPDWIDSLIDLCASGM